MSLLNRVLHISSTCRGEVLPGYVIKVEERMFEGSKVQPQQQARIFLAQADEVDPGPQDSYYFETTIAAMRQSEPPFEPTGGGLIQIPKNDEDEPEWDGVEVGDKIIYVMAPVSIIDGLPAPGNLEDEQTIADIIGVAGSGDVKKPLRNKVQSAAGRSNVNETNGDESTIEVPEPTTDEIVQEESRIQTTGQVRIKKSNAEALGIAKGSQVYVNMQRGENQISFIDDVGTSRRVSITRQQARELGFSLDDEEVPGEYSEVVMTVRRA